MKKYVLFQPTFLKSYYYFSGVVEISPQHIEATRVVSAPVFVGTEVEECKELRPKPKPFWKFWEKTEYELQKTGEVRHVNKIENRELLKIHTMSGDVWVVAEYEEE